MGWLVCTTDDSEALLSAIHKFVLGLTVPLTPVMDLQAAAAVMAGSADRVELRSSELATKTYIVSTFIAGAGR